MEPSRKSRVMTRELSVERHRPAADAMDTARIAQQTLAPLVELACLAAFAGRGFGARSVPFEAVPPGMGAPSAFHDRLGPVARSASSQTESRSLAGPNQSKSCSDGRLWHSASRPSANGGRARLAAALCFAPARRPEGVRR